MAKADARAKILGAARSVFSEKGYRSSTVTDVIEKAAVARGTFYRYFPNKREVFYLIFRR